MKAQRAKRAGGRTGDIYLRNRRNKEKGGVTGIKDEEEGLCPRLRHSTGLEVKSRSGRRLLCLERPGHFYIYPQQ